MGYHLRSSPAQSAERDRPRAGLSRHLTVLSSKPILSLALLVGGGPILVFPDRLPIAWRTGVVTLITVAALGLAVVTLHPFRAIRVGLWLFVLAVVASWAVMLSHDLLSVRHFAGIGVGVLAMSVVATWCTTSSRLIATALLFALASTAALTLGLLGTSITTAKLVVVATRMTSEPLYPWLPQLRLGLPGLEQSAGQVNANALGGTALMVLPTCAGLTAAAFVALRRRRLLLVTGSVATALSLTVLVLTRSRGALLAALVTLTVWGLRWRRGRWWILAALLILGIGVVYWANQARALSPDDFTEGVRFMRHSLLLRMATWSDAIDRLREAPWFGIGINQFHEMSGPTSAYSASQGAIRVAHAHNTLIQVALDVGLVGLTGYVVLMCTLVVAADRAARRSGPVGRIVAGAGLSLVAVHLFGLSDAIALGAKVGLFQWMCAGLILASSHLSLKASG